MNSSNLSSFTSFPSFQHRLQKSVKSINKPGPGLWSMNNRLSRKKNNRTVGKKHTKKHFISFFIGTQSKSVKLLEPKACERISERQICELLRFVSVNCVNKPKRSSFQQLCCCCCCCSPPSGKQREPVFLQQSSSWLRPSELRGKPRLTVFLCALVCFLAGFWLPPHTSQCGNLREQRVPLSARSGPQHGAKRVWNDGAGKKSPHFHETRCPPSRRVH